MRILNEILTKILPYKFSLWSFWNLLKLILAKGAYETIQTAQAANACDAKKPLILNLTNFVTMQWVANVELAMGASPLMSVCHQEFSEILQHADALYINLGTLDEQFIGNGLLATKLAKQLNKPIVLDPVGCGFTQLRTNAALELMPYADVVRGNASEIKGLSNSCIKGVPDNTACFRDDKLIIQKGVDATATVELAAAQAQSIAEKYHCICVVTGKKDFICSAEHSASFSFGSELMTKITGMGCALGGVLAAFLACHDDVYLACVEALLFYTLSAQQIAGAHSLGQFSHQFIDALHFPDWENLQKIYNHARCI